MNTIIDDKINMLANIRSVLGGGHLLMVYRECDSLYAENIARDIVREYRVSRKILPTHVECDVDTLDDIEKVDDDVRLIVAFGGKEVIELCKIASTMLGIPLIVVLTTPSLIDIHKAYIFNDDSIEIDKVNEPELIIIDTKYLNRYQDFGVIIGDVAGRLLSYVDDQFLNIIDQNTIKNDNHIIDEISKIDEIDKVSILKASAFLIDRSTGLVEMISRLISHNSEIAIDSSKVKFALTYTILLMYKSYLNCVSDDLYLPPDIVNNALLSNRIFDMDMNKAIMEYKGMTSEIYMKYQHLIAEYRCELVDMVDSAIDIMSRLSKSYRRLSKDAGYKMYDGITIDDLMESISLLSIFERQDTILRIMKSSGIIERYIRD